VYYALKEISIFDLAAFKLNIDRGLMNYVKPRLDFKIFDFLRFYNVVFILLVTLTYKEQINGLYVQISKLLGIFN